MNKLKHLAVIMDGNGRWATNQNKKRIKGHEKGASRVEDIAKYCAKDPDIEVLTLYAFSTENWKRPKVEIDFLMLLLNKYLKNTLDAYQEHNVKFETIGDLSKFSSKLKRQIQYTKDQTKNNTALTHILAINYGAKDEMLRAMNNILLMGKTTISQEEFEEELDISIPVDLLIRTGGNPRISNFLLWQIAYAELHFTDTLWPDFNDEELSAIIKKYSKSQRRFGGL